MRGVLLAVLITVLGGAFAPARARVGVFIGGAFPVAPYPYYAPYPYPSYPVPYPYAVPYSVPPPGWEAGHWESHRDASGRAIWVWVPAHLR